LDNDFSAAPVTLRNLRANACPLALERSAKPTCL
jgi:hypothetical protein